MQKFRYASTAFVFFCSAASAGVSGFCGIGMDSRAAISDCTDVIDRWVLKEPLPTDPQLASQYYNKGAMAYYWRAQSYALAGENGRAIHDFTESIRLSNLTNESSVVGVSSPLTGRAHAYFAAGLYDLAIKDFNALLEYHDKDTLLKAMDLLMRGNAFLEKDDYSHALADFNAGLAAAPLMFDLYIARARVYIVTEQPDLAVSDCTTALTLYPKAASAHMRRGLAYWLKKSYRLAEEDLSTSISLEPEIMSYYYRADIYKRQGRVNEAVADWKKVLELDSRSIIREGTSAKSGG